VIPPVAARLPDGRRLHLQHGPMDVILEVTGPRDAVARAETAAIVRFERILDELVPQLPSLRAPLGPPVRPVGTVARRMVEAAERFAGVFLTPMICVAGSVADELRHVIAETPGVERAYVNNGGDVAVHLTAGTSLRVGLVPSVEDGRHEARLELTADSPVRGVATSGWGGRSFSLGIADAVTVVGSSTALADVAASLVANAVDLPGHPAVERVPAHELDPDSDLGDRLVTTGVGALADAEVAEALGRGVVEAERLMGEVPGVLGAALSLRDQRRFVGVLSHLRLAPTLTGGATRG
jgi:ApbE superfamily uncharacterized protein (UPF0280 family)